MSMPDRSGPAARAPHSSSSGISPRGQRALLLVTVCVLLAITGTYAAFGDWATAAGVVCGGGLVLVLLHVAGRRATRRGADAATAERVFSGRGDERDNRVYLVAMSVVGFVAFITVALLPAAVGLGLDADGALRALPYLLIVTGVVSFVVADRRT